MKIGNLLLNIVKRHIKCALFTPLLWVFYMIFTLVSCKSSDVFYVEGIEAYKAENSSEKLPYIKLTKHPRLHIAEIHSLGIHFSVALAIKGIDGEPKLVLYTQNRMPRTPGADASKLLHPEVPFVVNNKGHISKYNRDDKEWCVMVLSTNDEVVIIWNRQDAGDSAFFKHKSAPYVYRKVKFNSKKLAIEDLDG